MASVEEEHDGPGAGGVAGGDDLGDDFEGLAVAAEGEGVEGVVEAAGAVGAGPARVGRGGNRGAGSERGGVDGVGGAGDVAAAAGGVDAARSEPERELGVAGGQEVGEGAVDGDGQRAVGPVVGAELGMADDEVPAAELGSGRGDGERLVEGVGEFGSAPAGGDGPAVGECADDDVAGFGTALEGRVLGPGGGGESQPDEHDQRDQ